MANQNNENHSIGFWHGMLALSPLFVFLCLYLVASLIIGDFYKIPISVAFLVASAYGIAITYGLPLRARIDKFSAGAGNSNIMLMLWIFILAGAFANTAKDIGSIDATVNLILQWLPERLIPAGLFIGACFISLSIGTSVGTIVALVPVGAGIADATGVNEAFMVAIIVGGAFFGDNLSFISDTTIAATRTQGCNMQDKFYTNLRIVMPAAMLVCLFYVFYGIEQVPSDIVTGEVNYLKVIPYLLVLITAMLGINVSIVLVSGIISTGIIGLCTHSIGGILGWVGSMGTGIDGMGDLIVITILAGGMLELIRLNGGIEFILNALTKHVRGPRGAQLSIAALVSLANICTANNTIAIITVGPIASDIAKRFGVDARKSASILDTFSCVIQGVLPYGAQLLMAASLAQLSPIGIIAYLYYPMTVCLFALLGIIIKNPKHKKSR